ncbi:MAG: mechanosensitive ion channel domain-containing protein [Chloroflexota bacterium]
MATAKLIKTDQPLDFLIPYNQYIAVGLIVIFGAFVVEFGSQWIYGVAHRRSGSDIAAALRVVARLAAYAIILATVVSLLTSNAAAALTAGSFAGLVAGLATQTVIGNAVAGVFLAISRPVRIGDNITVGGNSGTVKNITLMHTVLNAEDRDIMIPSSNIVTSVLVKHFSVQ